MDDKTIELISQLEITIAEHVLNEGLTLKDGIDIALNAASGLVMNTNHRQESEPAQMLKRHYDTSSAQIGVQMSDELDSYTDTYKSSPRDLFSVVDNEVA